MSRQGDDFLAGAYHTRVIKQIMLNVTHYSRYSAQLFITGMCCLALWLPSQARAEQQVESLCTTPPYQARPGLGATDDERINIEADKVTLTEDNTSLFSGNVDIRQRDQIINADTVEFKQNENFLRAEGDVNVFTRQLKLSGSKAEFNTQTRQGEIHDAEYATTQRGRGGASSIKLLSEDVLLMTRARYTTCDPDKIDWQMSAKEIKLDNSTRQGYADNVVLQFKGVPFFYFPYLRFPVGEERLSGFLFPSFGSSDQHGSELLLPYYWNIAPDLDATITPWLMSKRGILLRNEVRYLNQNSHGQLELDYLDKDKEFDEQERIRARWTHRGKPASGWSTAVDMNYVEDNQHLVDFSTDLENTSTTHLNRRGSVTYNASSWSFSGRLQSYQTLTGATPYRRLPQLKLASRDVEIDQQFNFYLDSELVRFDHPDEKIIGNRLDLTARVSYPLRSAATHFIPRLHLRHTQYQLEQTPVGQEQDPDRNIPIFSIDSGVVFERDTHFAGQAYTQTLEPQLFYLYVPYRDQSSLPVFDTSSYGFSINNPFVEDRFIGADRVGDANQLTAALATRFYHNDSGAEVFSARIGQVFYFADREVTLPGRSIETAPKSNIVAEIIARPTSHWYLGTDLEWDIEQDEMANGNARLSYEPGQNLHIQGTYRFEREVLKTAELGFRWRMTPKWQLIARRVDDLLAERVQEEQLALRYDSCCWGLTLQLEDRFRSELLERDQAIYLQLELKGLSSIGDRRAISGFE
jgi:LPS-assembly protein